MEILFLAVRNCETSDKDVFFIPSTETAKMPMIS